MSGEGDKTIMGEPLSFREGLASTDRFLREYPNTSKVWRKFQDRRADICAIHSALDILLNGAPENLIDQPAIAEGLVQQVYGGMKAVTSAERVIKHEKKERRQMMHKIGYAVSMAKGYIGSTRAIDSTVYNDVSVQKPFWLSGHISLENEEFIKLAKSVGWKLKADREGGIPVDSVLLEASHKLRKHRNKVLLDNEYKLMANLFDLHFQIGDMDINLVGAMVGRGQADQFRLDILEFNQETPSIENILKLAFACSPGQINTAVKSLGYGTIGKNAPIFGVLQMFDIFVQQTYDALLDTEDPKHRHAINIIKGLSEGQESNFFTLFAIGAHNRDKEGLIDVTKLSSTLIKLGGTNRGNGMQDSIVSSNYLLAGLEIAIALDDYYYFKADEITNAFDQFHWDSPDEDTTDVFKKRLEQIDDRVLLNADNIRLQELLKMDDIPFEYVNVQHSENNNRELVVTIKSDKIFRMTINLDDITSSAHLPDPSQVDEGIINNITNFVVTCMEKQVEETFEIEREEKRVVLEASQVIEEAQAGDVKITYRSKPKGPAIRSKGTGKRRRHQKRIPKSPDTAITLRKGSPISYEVVIPEVCDLPSEERLRDSTLQKLEALQVGEITPGMDFKSSQSANANIWQFRVNKYYRALVRRDGGTLEFIQTVHRSKLNEALRNL